MFWSSRSRREQAAASLEAAAGNVWQLGAMTTPERDACFSCAREVLLQSDFESLAGFALSDEMRATVALQAALLVHGMPAGARPTRLRFILYPDYFSEPGEEGGSVLMGEVGMFGAIALAWRNVLISGLDPDDSHVVGHELAHVLDGLTGEIDGTPPIPDATQREHWKTQFGDEFEQHQVAQARRRSTLLSEYAATSPGEFLAEAASTFLQSGAELQADRPHLYGLLRQFFGTHPAQWVRPAPEAVDPRLAELRAGRFDLETQAYRRLVAEWPEHGEYRKDLALCLLEAGDLEAGLRTYDEAIALGCDDADSLAERGRWRVDAGDFVGAVSDFGRALAAAPGWAETLCDRASAHRLAGEFAKARSDLESALALDGESDLAYAERAAVNLAEGRRAEARADLTRAIALNAADVELWLMRAQVHYDLGDLAEGDADLTEAGRLGALPEEMAAARASRGE